MRIRTLSREDCLDLLAGTSIGRIASTIDAMPAILPVSFRLLGESVLFCAQDRSRLSLATDGKIVAFQSDSFNPELEEGWTVHGVGRPYRVLNPETVLRPGSDVLDPWPLGEVADHLMRLDLPTVSGHVIGFM
jgi:uncharacterized protein